MDQVVHTEARPQAAKEVRGYKLWPPVIGLGAGPLAVGVFFLITGSDIMLGLALIAVFAALIVGFLFQEIRRWASARALGIIPPAGIFPGEHGTDIGFTVAMFLFTEFVFFGGAFGTYFYYRSQFPSWPPPNAPHLDVLIPSIQTLMLISSSIMIEWSISQIRKGNINRFEVGVVTTTILGSMFSVLQLGVEYPYLLLNGILTPSYGFFGTSFYLLTGIHGVHVLVGVVGFVFLSVRALTGQFSQANYGFVEGVATYWHFVHIIWLFLFALIWH